MVRREPVAKQGLAFVLIVTVVFMSVSVLYGTGIWKVGAILDVSDVSTLLDAGGGVKLFLPQAIVSLDDPDVAIVKAESTENVQTTLNQLKETYGNTATVTTSSATSTIPSASTTTPVVTQTSTTTVTVDKTTMTGTVTTSNDYGGSIVDQISYPILTGGASTAVKTMVEKPAVKGSITINVRVWYTDGSYRDLKPTSVIVDIMAINLYDRETGKIVDRVTARAEGELSVEGMGDYCYADLAITLYVGDKPDPPFQRFILDPDTGFKAKVILEAEYSDLIRSLQPGEYSVATSLVIRAKLYEFWSREEMKTRSGKLRRFVELFGQKEGPKLGGLYEYVNPGVTSFDLGTVYGAYWRMTLTSGNTKGVEFNPQYVWMKDGKIHYGANVLMPGTYVFTLVPSKPGRFSGTELSLSLAKAGWVEGDVDFPAKPLPVNGKLNVVFTSYLDLSGGNRRMVESDTLHVIVAKFSLVGGTAGGQQVATTKVETLWEGTLKSGVPQSVSFTINQGESISVRAEKSLGTFQKEETKYGGYVAQTVFDGGDWYDYCASSERTVSIDAIVPYGTVIPEFQVSQTQKDRTVSIQQPPENNVVVTTELPYSNIGQVKEGTPGAKKLTIEAYPGQVAPQPGTYWFKENSKVPIRVICGADRLEVDGQVVLYGGYQTYWLVMNTDHYVKVIGGAEVTYGIEGWVKDGTSGTPLAGCRVQVFKYGQSDRLAETSTNSEGYFRIEGLKQYESYDLVVAKEGFKEFRASTSAPNSLTILLYPPSSSSKEYPPNTYVIQNPGGTMTVTVRGNEETRLVYANTEKGLQEIARESDMGGGFVGTQGPSTWKTANDKATVTQFKPDGSETFRRDIPLGGGATITMDKGAPSFPSVQVSFTIDFASALLFTTALALSVMVFLLLRRRIR
jgi:hypothetical protein